MQNSHFQKSVTSNGITVVTETIPYVRSVALGVWITVGSRDESAQNCGISHFVEHMLFKGTKTRNAQQIAESLENLGGSLDAFTTKELTCYSAHCLDEHLPVAVDVIADLITNSVFDKTEIEKEKEVILNEINHYKDTPDDIIFDHYYEQVFAGHPLAYHIYGNEENARSFDREEITEFQKKHYGTNRIVISVAGNCTHENVIALIETYLGNHQSAVQRSVIDFTEFEKPHMRIFKKPCNQAHVCMGSNGLAYKDDAKFPFLILHTLLGGGMSSLLFQKIRETYGLVYTIFSFHDFFIDTGIWGIYYATDEKNIDQTNSLILEELHHLMNGYMSDEIVTKVKSQLKGGLILGMESIASRMSRLAKNEIYLQEHYSIDTIIQKIDEVTTQDILTVAQSLFESDNYYKTILKPSHS